MSQARAHFRFFGGNMGWSMGSCKWTHQGLIMFIGISFTDHRGFVPLFHLVSIIMGLAKFIRHLNLSDLKKN